ncbi:putative HLH transcription factor [Taphrina deformans PYCC 5710]|uniref:HLH transcription factor n=1 Tax=Taphrina deformans (strain PYCC 5710 / ATCC 11124 / CBS 356.35 / IMI 108563 / JCM 9778 / NBRC 8474) TaxID=1097556 RepID=R4X7F6_TAPDE|nr:putative HLH transcription factor [Taphrina deformans PYCC 5710]|eukprot:CCG81321.1 putative HLH transcription factor [Taphrina deformans PYCC 5710]
MGRSRSDTTTYLATPPSSYMLRPKSDETLPELSLGPAKISQLHSQSSHTDRAVPGKDDSCSPISPVSRIPSAASSENCAPPKRGKPSRKTTHSQIEKRRREKINDTMQRLKDLVPACHDPEALLRKLDVLTATADYIEELHTQLERQQPDRGSDLVVRQGVSRINSQTYLSQNHRSTREQKTACYVESSSNSSVDVMDTSDREEVRLTPVSSPERPPMHNEEVNAAESLIQIATSPMLRPVVERQRLSISELMHL